MADVKIRVIGEDKASRELAKIDKSTVGAFGSITELASGVNLAKMAFDVFVGAASSTVKTLMALADATTDYARQVREMGMMMGTSADETSRLIQLADDYLISVDEMRLAMQMAVKNGFAPGVEGLAQLADQYLALATPTERAAMLSEIFGRNWARMVPLLEQGGDAVRSQAAAIDENLLMTDEAVKAAREYEIAQDNLNDSVEGVKNQIGQALIPILTKYAEHATESMEGTKAWGEETTILTDALTALASAAASPGLKSSLGIFARIGGMGSLATVLAEVAKEEENAAAMTKGLTSAIEGQIQRAEEGAVAGENFAQAQAEAADELGIGVEQLGAYAIAIRDYQESLEDQTRATEANTVANQLRQSSLEDLRDLEQEMAEAQGQLAEAQQRWNDTLGGDMSNALEKAGASAERLRQAYVLMDKSLGTNLTMQYDYQQGFMKLAEDWVNNPNMTEEEFTTRLEGLRDLFAPLEEGIGEAMTKVGELQAELDAVKNGNYDITIGIYYEYYGDPPGGSGGNGQHGSYSGKNNTEQERSMMSGGGGGTSGPAQGGPSLTSAMQTLSSIFDSYTAQRIRSASRTGRGGYGG